MHGFAGRCLTTRPLHRGGCCDCTLRADDGIRTRDPHLGKVMRYQLRYIRAPRARCRHVRTETIVHPSMATQISPRLSNQPTAHHILAENAAHASLRPRSPASAWLGAGSRGSVGERPLHTRKVAGSIPAGTTGRITTSQGYLPLGTRERSAATPRVIRRLSAVAVSRRVRRAHPPHDRGRSRRGLRWCVRSP